VAVSGVHGREGFLRALCKEKINEFTWGARGVAMLPAVGCGASHSNASGKRRVIQAWTSYDGAVLLRLGLSSVVCSEGEGEVYAGEGHGLTGVSWD
jgi:hypothetical protein